MTIKQTRRVILGFIMRNSRTTLFLVKDVFYLPVFFILLDITGNVEKHRLKHSLMELSKVLLLTVIEKA